jgi:hypothetical protein
MTRRTQFSSVACLLTAFCAASAALLPAAPARAQKQSATNPKDAPARKVAPAPAATTTTYYGMYIRGEKIGFNVIEQTKDATFEGRPARKTTSRTEARLNVLGTVTEINEQSTSYDDPKTGLPLFVESRTESGGKASVVRARYGADSVSYEVDVQGATRKDTLKLAPGEKFLVDPSNGVEKVPPAGTKLTGKVFIPEPSLLRLVDVEVTVGGPETINVAGQVVTGTKIVVKNPIAVSTTWLDAAGSPLRTDATLGLQTFREPKEMALAPAKKAADLMALVGIRPTGTMDDPRATTFARYEFAQVTRPFPPDDTVQRTKETTPAGDAGRVVEITVTTGPLPEGPTAPVFASPDTAPDNLKPFLKSTLYVQSDLPALRAEAKRVIGTDTDCAVVARKLSEYVFRRMKPDPTISNIRVASDIWQDPRGVCRDYTLLYTSLARAVGLPTKQCLGLAYFNGSFLGHAWPEVWVGKDASGRDRWVALEPTWGKPFADAAHVKLAEGEMSDFFAVAADFGQYKIRILEAK